MMEAKTDRRIKRTRYLLVHALTSLMLKKSIKDISVKELCESVDINRGTFYLHYKDIYDMLEQTEQELLEQFEQVFKNYHPDHTPDFPYPLFVEIFQIIDQNSDLCCALLSPNGDISFSVKIKKLFEHQYIHEWMVAHHSADFLPTYEYFSNFLRLFRSDRVMAGSWKKGDAGGDGKTYQQTDFYRNDVCLSDTLRTA